MLNILLIKLACYPITQAIFFSILGAMLLGMFGLLIRSVNVGSKIVVCYSVQLLQKAMKETSIAL